MRHGEKVCLCICCFFLMLYIQYLLFLLPAPIHPNLWFTGSQSKDRHFFGPSFNHLRKYLHSLTHLSGLTENDYETFLNQLNTSDFLAYKELALLISKYTSITDGKAQVDEEVLEFLKCLCSVVSPLSSLVPYMLLPILEKLAHGSDIDITMQEQLFEHAPIFYRFYQRILMKDDLMDVRPCHDTY